MQCANCADYSLCASCEELSCNPESSTHDRSHVFLKIRHPLKSSDDEGSPAPLFGPIPSLYPESTHHFESFFCNGVECCLKSRVYRQLLGLQVHRNSQV